MRRIIAISLTLAVVWMAWWVIGSTLLERSLTNWLEDRRAEGWVADYSDLSVRGFPNRFDTRLTDIRLADPATGVAWAAPFFEILQLSYQPNAAIVVWPNTQTFSTPFQTVDIVTDRARGSVSFRPTPALELDRSTVVLEQARLRSNAGWRTTLGEARFSVQRQDEANTYRLGAEMLDLRPSQSIVTVLDPADVLPDVIQSLRLDATLRLTGPLDRHVIEQARPQITVLDLAELSARWGDVTFRAAGTLDIDATGLPDGDLALRAEDWRRLLDMAVSTGLLAETFLPVIDSTLELMAGMSGTPDTLDATLSFQNGRVSLGPIPLGPAPRIIVR